MLICDLEQQRLEPLPYEKPSRTYYILEMKSPKTPMQL